MRKLLLKLLIVQVASNKNRTKKLGRGFDKAYRINPYNPLSYPAIVIIFIVGVLMFGFVGLWKETDTRNPFKWN